MEPKNDNIFCPLCSSLNTGLFFRDNKRRYMKCRHCCLIFVPEPYWLSRKQEKAVYDRHQNDPSDSGYRRFLSRLSKPLAERIQPGQKGLDFGCGPGPTLSVMLEEEGHLVTLYDPFYHNQVSVFDQTYDFITSTEVVEHLHTPAQTFDTMFGMLRPGGWLGLMTKLATDKEAFTKWHYIRDMTHVCFYSRPTFSYLAERFNVGLTIIGADVILLKKP